jgi:hypothetical protein
MIDTLESTTRCFFENAVGQADAMGINVRIISGRRTVAKQTELRNRWERCRDMNPVARALSKECRNALPADEPRESPHVYGMAVDAAPICTSRFAVAYNSGFTLVGQTSTASPYGSANPTGPLNPGAPSLADCGRVPDYGLWQVWHRVLRENYMDVPLPDTDKPHSENRDFRRLLRLNCLRIPS